MDVELPGDIPLKELLPDIFKVLLQNPEAKDLKNISLRNEEGDSLDVKKSLDAQNILNSEILWIDFGDGSKQAHPARKQPPVLQANGTKKKKVTENRKPSQSVQPINEIATDRRGQIKLREKAEFKVEHPCLLYEGDEKGYVFILGDSLASLGRPKKDYRPDIDLSEIDIAKVSSRPHAEIEKKDGKYFLRALKATNGMFVNSAEMALNETRMLEDRDVLQVGFQGVKLVFRMPKSLPKRPG